MYGGALHSNYLVAGLDPDVERSLSGDESYGGGNVIGRVDHQWSDALSAQIQTYYDHAYRNDQVSDQQINTYDIDTTMVWKQSDRTTLTAGAGYRVIDDAIRGVDEIFGTFEPEHRNQAITNVFFQQDIALIPKSVTLTVGSKYERNNLTIAAFQPTVRMSWQVSAEHLIWAAWSRAKRFPSRLDLDSKLNLSTTRLPDGTPALVGIDGNRGFDGEGVYSHELGYRYVGEEGWSVDFAGFYSHYDALRDFRPGAPTPFLTSRGTALRLPNRIDTKGAANSYGLEIVASTRVTDSWRLEAWYSWIAIDDVDTAFPLDIITVASDMDVPEHQGFLRSNMTLSESVELDLMARFVDSLSGSGMASRYIEADVRFGWKAADGLVVSLVGQNLLDRSHKEFSDFLTSAPGAQRERGVYGQLEYRF
jgi:iron complex outermembrane receptor protein